MESGACVESGVEPCTLRITTSNLFFRTRRIVAFVARESVRIPDYLSPSRGRFAKCAKVGIKDEPRAAALTFALFAILARDPSGIWASFDLAPKCPGTHASYLRNGTLGLLRHH